MVDVADVEFLRMSFEDYWDLPSQPSAEYVDGEVVVSPPASYRHQRICVRLVLALSEVVQEPLEVVTEAGWRLPGPRVRIRIPDVMVVCSAPDGILVTEPPLVAVEVVSGNRADDLVRKSTEYLEAGLGQYWVVDPRDRTIDIFQRTDSGWESLAHLDNRHDVAEVPIGPAHLTLSLRHLLGSS